MVLCTVKGVVVTQDDSGKVTWESGADVDADGANGQNGNPFAYRYPDNEGLDTLANAGWPFYSWRNVLFDNGSRHPLTDGKGNAYSQTTYSWQGRHLATRFLDATSIPYVVVNPLVRLHAAGVVLGCKAELSYKGKTIEAVAGDVSGPEDIGEVSMYAALLLGIPDSPRTGGLTTKDPGDGITFSLYPGIPALLNGETYRLIRASI